MREFLWLKIGGLVIGGTILGLWFRDAFEKREWQVRTRYAAVVNSHREKGEQERLMLEKQHAAELGSLEVIWESNRLELKRQFQTELERAWAGPLGRAIKDPDLNIEQMLHNAAQACSPEGSRVEVKPDHFTEMDAQIFLKHRLKKQDTITLAKNFLANCAEYVNAVRIWHSEELIISVDKRMIDQIGNWKEASIQQLTELLK